MSNCQQFKFVLCVLVRLQVLLRNLHQDFITKNADAVVFCVTLWVVQTSIANPFPLLTKQNMQLPVKVGNS